MTSQHLVPVMNLYIQKFETLTFSSKSRLLGEKKREGALQKDVNVHDTRNKAYSG